MQEIYRKVKLKHQKTNKKTILSKFIKKDPFPEQLKQAYSYNYIQWYSSQIFETFNRKSQISNEKGFIKEIQKHQRAKIIDWMLCFLQYNNLKQEIMFHAIFIMDQYYKSLKSPQMYEKSTIIEAACIFIACKYEYKTFPLDLKSFCNTQCREILKAEDLLKKQAQILLGLQFNLISRDVFSFTSVILIMIESKVKHKLGKEEKQIFRSLMSHLGKVFLIENPSFNQNLVVSGISIVFCTINIFKSSSDCQISILEDYGKILNEIANQYVMDWEQIESSQIQLLKSAFNIGFHYPELKNLN